MFSILTQEFHSSLPLDNGLLIADVKNGVPISEKEIIDVAINARALFVVSALACRELVRIEDCFKLWSETRELIDGLLTGWSEVAAGDHPRVAWLLTELRRLESLCTDRCELYTITTTERLRHVKTRGDACFEYSFTQRNGREPKGEHNSTPAHVYSVGHF
jgi:hypothetical protein